MSEEIIEGSFIETSPSPYSFVLKLADGRVTVRTVSDCYSIGEATSLMISRIATTTEILDTKEGFYSLADWNNDSTSQQF